MAKVLNIWATEDEMDPLLDLVAYIVGCGACVNGLSAPTDVIQKENQFRDRVNQICKDRNLDRTKFLIEFMAKLRHSRDGFALLEEMAQ